MTRRPTLRAVAKSRGMSAAVYGGGGMWSGRAGPVSGWEFMGPFIQIDSHSRRAAEAGLRAALEAMPMKEKKR